MIFRLTQKCANQINSNLQGETLAENRYCDWTCDITDYNEEKFFIISNTFSLFTIVFPANNIDNEMLFAKTATEEIISYLKEQNLDEIFSSQIEKNLEKFRFEKTNSKSILRGISSFKNELGFLLRFLSNKKGKEKFFQIDSGFNDKKRKLSSVDEKNSICPKELFVSEKMKEPVSSITCTTAEKQTKVYKIYAELEDFKPKIWRRFLVNPQISMDKFAFALMAMFNMDGSHIFQFDFPAKELQAAQLKKEGMEDTEIKVALALTADIIVQYYVDDEMDSFDDDFIVNELKQVPPMRLEAYETKLSKLFKNSGDFMTFSYDFGDGWKIKLTLEDENALSDLSVKKVPLVLEGERLGIIEDCGGVERLEEIREAFKSKKSEYYKNLKEMFGAEIDLDAFNKDEINKTLSKKIKAFAEEFSE